MEIRELHDALRLKRQLEHRKKDGEEIDPEQVKDLDRYVDLMTSWGHGVLDDVSQGTGDDGPVLEVRWERASDLWRSVKRNINKNGVFLQTDSYPSIDTTVDLRIHIAWPPLTIRRPAKVIWVNPQQRAGRPMGMGLKFLWASDEEDELFKAFMKGDVEPAALQRLS